MEKRISRKGRDGRKGIIWRGKPGTRANGTGQQAGHVKRIPPGEGGLALTVDQRSTINDQPSTINHQPARRAVSKGLDLRD